jgi:hypothetical protein
MSNLVYDSQINLIADHSVRAVLVNGLVNKVWGNEYTQQWNNW